MLPACLLVPPPLPRRTSWRVISFCSTRMALAGTEPAGVEGPDEFADTAPPPGVLAGVMGLLDIMGMDDMGMGGRGSGRGGGDKMGMVVVGTVGRSAGGATAGVVEAGALRDEGADADAGAAPFTFTFPLLLWAVGAFASTLDSLSLEAPGCEDELAEEASGAGAGAETEAEAGGDVEDSSLIGWSILAFLVGFSVVSTGANWAADILMLDCNEMMVGSFLSRLRLMGSMELCRGWRGDV